ERPEALLAMLQVVAEPDAAHAGGRHHDSLLAQLVGEPHLAPRRLLDGSLQHRLLDRLLDPVLQERLATAELPQGLLPARLVQLLESIETIPAVTHDLAGLGNAPQLLRQLQYSYLRSDDFLLSAHVHFPFS